MNKIHEFELNTKYFVKDKQVSLGARLAKFTLKVGDIFRFHEIDKYDKRTGKRYDRIVTNFHKIHKATKYWKKKELLKYGVYIFELKCLRRRWDSNPR